MYNKIVNKEVKISVIGLGYVGLPIALEFAKKVSVIGFDIKPDRVEMMKIGIDPSNELPKESFEGCDIEFTANPEDLKEANFHIVAVPTPIDEHNLPDLTPLLGASKLLSKQLKKGDYVVFESTVYPGCTEEDCIPVLEEGSGLNFMEDFKVGYSPERINPGDTKHTLTKIVKVVSGCDDESADIIEQVYGMIITAGIHKASSIKVAEAAKIIENTQRDVNIALMNELSMIFNNMDINTYEVLEAAGTKWNFLNFKPGLVGGHCIGVDPYYLVYKSREFGYHPHIINSGRSINDSMGKYIANKTMKFIASNDKNIVGSRVLVMGTTFKENVSDIRNSKVVDVINELKSYSVDVEVIDPHASSEEVMKEYGYELVEEPTGTYSAVILAVGHEEYVNLEESDFKSLLNGDGVLVDIKGVYLGKIKNIQYWSL